MNNEQELDLPEFETGQKSNSSFELRCAFLSSYPFPVCVFLVPCATTSVEDFLLKTALNSSKAYCLLEYNMCLKLSAALPFNTPIGLLHLFFLPVSSSATFSSCSGFSISCA